MRPNVSSRAPRRACLLAIALVAASVPIARAAAPDRSGDEKRPYVVVLKNRSANAKAAAADHGRRFGVAVKTLYGKGLRGYAGSMTDEDAKRLSREPGVVIAPDSEVTAFGVQSTATTPYGTPPLWGLDRIDEHQRSVPAENLYHYSATGAGVTAYVIDSGVRTAHNEFEGRAKVGFDAFGGSGQDCWGHGTHVAGILGGKTFGVAKKVNIVSVKVLNCSGSGTVSNVVAGINWVTGNHAAGKPAVANMSLGGGANAALDEAVAQSIADGITYSIAAGNGNVFGSGVNACNTSPARVPAALTTGATDNTDKKTTWSNYGSCVDVFAPGNNIPSAWGSTTDPNAWRAVSGTSMAAPAVGGVAALFLELVPGASPGQVSQTVTGMATPNVVTSSNTTGAKLLFAPWQDSDVSAAKDKLDDTAAPTPPPPPPPSCFLCGILA
ncbi:MAG: S8 family serine peptidase [Acidimicrobiia bacterium]